MNGNLNIKKEKLQVKYRCSCQILIILNFIDRFKKNAQISNFTNVCTLGAELFHSEGQTDITKLTVSFRNFSNPTKNGRKGNRLSEWEADWTGSGSCLIAGISTSVAETSSPAPFSSILQRAALQYSSRADGTADRSTALHPGRMA